MSGHSKWAQIKHKKGAADQKRGALFSKLLAAITIAAKTEPNPDFNPRLRTAIERAKKEGVPGENIERAIKRASETGQNLEELILEAYGPGGAAMLIEAATDNKNRTIPEIKKILSDAGGKWAESGSVRWAFEKTPGGWQAKFPQIVSDDDRKKLEALIAALREHDDVQEVYVNVKNG
jgi:YebC/PmpR family DNA-binding regulatory protein